MSSSPTRVLIAGGGVAGLESLLALQALAGERVEIELLAPERHFTPRPLAVAEPFRADSLQRLPLAAIAEDRGVTLHRDAIAALLPGERRSRRRAAHGSSTTRSCSRSARARSRRCAAR